MGRATGPAAPPGAVAPPLNEVVRGRMPVLDGWRGLAILLVVLHNAGSIMRADGSVVSTLVRTALAAGWVGVSLFFVLSGFLITGILLDTRGDPHFLRNFFVRRTLRIFPLYYAALVVLCLIAPHVIGGEWAASVQARQLWYWTYLANWALWTDGAVGLSHFWSLGVEEQFYLLWPFIVLLAGARWFPRVTALVVVAAMGSRWLMHAGGLPPQALYQSTIARADGLAIGALLAVATRRRPWLPSLWRARWLVLGLGAGATAAVFIRSRGFEAFDPLVQIVGQTAVVVLFGALLLVTIRPTDPWLERLAAGVGRSWLRALGKYSYAIYIIHMPLHVLMTPLAEPAVNAGGPVVRATLTVSYGVGLLLASTALAYASWHGFEKHFVALKDRLAPRSGPYEPLRA